MTEEEQEDYAYYSLDIKLKLSYMYYIKYSYINGCIKISTLDSFNEFYWEDEKCNVVLKEIQDVFPIIFRVEIEENVYLINPSLIKSVELYSYVASILIKFDNNGVIPSSLCKLFPEDKLFKKLKKQFQALSKEYGFNIEDGR